MLQIGGIEIKYQTALGRDISLDQLREKYDCVFIGVGIGDVNALNIPGEDYPGVNDAVDYISQLRQTKKLAELPVGRRIVVIGAGMTAIDIAVQSKKLGAEEVTMVYRRERSAMGASLHEQELAQKHGVRFICNAQPHKINGSEHGLSDIEFERTYVNDAGKLVSSDEIISVSCDVVFKAIGQKLKGSILDGNMQVPTIDNRGRIAVDEHFQTSLKGVYAGGDCIDGKDLVVEAVDHGNKAALAIHQMLQQLGSQ